MRRIFKLAQDYASKQGCRELQLTHIKEAVLHVEFLDDDALRLFEKLLDMKIEMKSLYCNEDYASYPDSFSIRAVSEEVGMFVDELEKVNYLSTNRHSFSLNKDISFVDDELSRDKKTQAHGDIFIAQTDKGNHIFLVILDDKCSEEEKKDITLKIKELYPTFGHGIPNLDVMVRWTDINREICDSLQKIGVKDLYLWKGGSRPGFFFINNGEVAKVPLADAPPSKYWYKEGYLS